MLRSFIPQDLLAGMDRAQRELMSSLDYSPAIRGMGRGGYPALNVGSTPGSVEVWSRVTVADGLEVHLEPGRAGLTPEQVRAFIRGMAALYRQTRSEQNTGTPRDVV